MFFPLFLLWPSFSTANSLLLNLSMYSHTYGVENHIGNYALKLLIYQTFYSITLWLKVMVLILYRCFTVCLSVTWLLLLRLFQPTVSVLYVVSPDHSSGGWIQKLCFLCSTAPAAHALCGEWAQFPKCAWVKRSTEKTGNFQGKKNACEHAWDLNGHWWIMTMQSLIKVNVFHTVSFPTGHQYLHVSFLLSCY